MSVRDKLQAISGVDVEQGLRVVAGNEALYIRLMGKLSPVIEKSLAVIKDTLCGLEAIAFEAHTLKGSMYNLGVVGMGDLARTLEQDAKSGDEAAVRAYLPEFIVRLEGFNAELTAALSA